MRLNLRTLLAYLDDPTLPESRSLGEQLSDNAEARQLTGRLKNLAIQPRMAAPSLQTAGTLDSNYVAQYVDNCLPPEQCPVFERACLKSDNALAEVAAVHQIVCRMSEQPAAISPRLRDRIYQVPTQENAPSSASATCEAPVGNSSGLENESVSTIDTAETRESGRQKLAKVADALAGLKTTEESPDSHRHASVASPQTVDTEMPPSSSRHWWILAAIVVVWISVWFTFPKATAWYHKIAGAFRSAPPELAATPESADSISEEIIPTATTAPSDSVKRLFSPAETVEASDEEELATNDRTINQLPELPSPAATLPAAPSPLGSPATPTSPSPAPAQESLSNNAAEPTIQAPEVPLLSEPLVETPALPPLLKEDDAAVTVDSQSPIAPSELPAPVPNVPAPEIHPTRSTEIAAELPAPPSSLPQDESTAATVRSDLPPLPGPHSLTSSGETTADLETPVDTPVPSSVVAAEAVSELSGQATGTETQLTAAVRDLPPIDLPDPESNSSATPSPLLPMSTSPGSPPVANNLVATSDRADHRSRSNETLESKVANAPQTALDGNSNLQFQQRVAMVSLDPKWSIVLPGGIGKLQARGRVSTWTLTFSGISKLTAAVENSEPAIEVRRCFALIQSTVANETLRIQTPKGPVFLTALQPNSELVMEVRPYLPPGYSADSTPTRYVLGCLGVQGTFVVGHNQNEKAISQDDWMMVDMDGQANHFHQPLPSNIVQSIEYLKNGTPMTSVATLNQTLSQPNGPTRLNELACRSIEPGNEEQIAQRSLAGIWCYYLGQMEPIAPILNDPAMKNEWPDHMESIRDCLLSDATARKQLQDTMGELWQDESLADRLVGYNPNEIKASIIQGLVNDLEHPTLARRVLAIQALKQLWQKDFAYDPLDKGPAFDASVQQWKQLLQDSLTSRIGVNPSPGLVPAAGR